MWEKNCKFSEYKMLTKKLALPRQKSYFYSKKCLKCYFKLSFPPLNNTHIIWDVEMFITLRKLKEDNSLLKHAYTMDLVSGQIKH